MSSAGRASAFTSASLSALFQLLEEFNQFHAFFPSRNADILSQLVYSALLVLFLANFVNEERLCGSIAFRRDVVGTLLFPAIQRVLQKLLCTLLRQS